MPSSPHILVIEDDPGIVGGLRKELVSEGYTVAIAHRGDEGLNLALHHAFDVVITDLRVPGLSGLEVVRRLHPARPRLPILLVTAFGTTETAIEATKLGAFDYLLKPFDMTELLDLVSRAVACNRMASEPIEVGAAESHQAAIIGNSRAMQAVYKEIGRVAGSAVTVLIRGETGTGKELVARALYQHSARAERPFIVVNCAAIPETLLESELFGHERGAFTGAHARRLGRFEQAQGGTLFLDEIGDLTPGTQVKLLRVLQEKYIQRVGGNDRVRVDVRVLAATHRNLEQAMEEHQFREDLFYRLSAVTITLPPLSRRTEDIPDLAKYFLQRSAAELGQDSPAIHPEAIGFLQNRPWPGNVRELENVLRQALLLARGFPITVEHVHQASTRTRRPALTANQSIADYLNDLLNRAQAGDLEGVRAQMIEDMERELFTRAIQLAQGNQARAARWLGVTRTTMRGKLAGFGMRPPADRPDTPADPPLDG